MRQRILWGLAVAWIVALTGARGWLAHVQTMPVAVSELTVEFGTSGHGVLSTLAPELSRIDRALIFRLFPHLADVQAGQYGFAEPLSALEALRAISQGQSVVYRFTITEGLRLTEILDRLEAHPELLGETPETDSLLESLSLEFSNPEGAFLAETYLWKSELSRIDVLQLAHQALVQTLNAAWASRTAAVDAVLSSPYELLILASIVEKETAVAEERPRIAGVFIERLRLGMRLQTDPTVIYGLGEDFNGDLTRADLRRPTPYNTYRINGLPPTPIASVGPDSLWAVAQPSITGELYFVADGKGGHVFAETLEAHNANVRKYQLKR